MYLSQQLQENFCWVHSSLQTSKEMTESHATEADSNFGLTKLQHKVRRLCSDDNERVTVWINPKSLIAWEKMLSTCW
jgi:hypothetical protein